jgi:hypothetical protein
MPGSVRAVRIAFAGDAGVFLAVFISAAWVLPEDIGDLLLAGAGTCSVCSVMCWLAQAPRDRRLLVRELVDAYMEEQEPKPTVLRAVGRR